MGASDPGNPVGFAFLPGCSFSFTKYPGFNATNIKMLLTLIDQNSPASFVPSNSSVAVFSNRMNLFSFSDFININLFALGIRPLKSLRGDHIC